jgi:hypothetical protein
MALQRRPRPGKAPPGGRRRPQANRAALAAARMRPPHTPPRPPHPVPPAAPPQAASYVSRRRLDDADFDPDAVDEEGLPLVYNEERIAAFWGTRPGELAGRCACARA